MAIADFETRMGGGRGVRFGVSGSLEIEARRSHRPYTLTYLIEKGGLSQDMVDAPLPGEGHPFA